MDEEAPSEGRAARQVLLRLAELPGYTWDADAEPFHSVRPHAPSRIPRARPS